MRSDARGMHPACCRPCAALCPPNRVDTAWDPFLIARRYAHQAEIEESVVLIFDPVQAERGSLSIQAFRLTDKFMKTFKGGDFSVSGLKRSGLTYETIFEQVEVILKTSHLGLAFIDQFQTKSDDTQLFDRLDLSTNHYLGKNIQLLMDCVDELSNETQKYTYYQRSLGRQQQQQQQYLTRRKLENAQRIQDGEEPLPDEDTSNNPLFKPIPAPSRLESLLVTGQMAQYCKQISQFSSQNFSKLFAANGVQGGLE